MNTLLFQIYHSSASKYIKFRKRLDKNISSGRFRQFARKKQNQLLNKVERLRRRVLQLQTQLKLATAGVALSLILNTTPVQAQTTLGPFVRNYPDNPLPPPLPFMPNPAPTYVDMDGDGDLDLVVGSDNYYSYRLNYFRNIGTEKDPTFFQIRQGDDDYPFDGVQLPFIPDVTFRSWVPTFADIDSDGDFDLLLGVNEFYKYGTVYENRTGPTFYFRNVGTSTNPSFEIQLSPYVPDLINPGNSTGNPFPGIGSQGSAHPTLADVDDDGDVDLVLGGYYYYGGGSNFLIQFYRNEKTNPTSTTEPPNFVALSANPFEENNNLDDLYPSTSFGDLDKDGDLDFFYAINGEILYRRNDGGLDFTEQTGSWMYNAADPGNSSGNPFNEINQFFNSSLNNATLTIADLDDDGDMDVTLGQNYNLEGKSLVYYENIGQGVLQLSQGIESPLDGIDLGDRSNASFADIDQDGDLDILTSGSVYSGYYDSSSENYITVSENFIKVFENVNGDFADITGTPKDKFSELNLGDDAKVLLIDVNGDDLLDVVAPYHVFDDYANITSSGIQYYKNVSGNLVEQTGLDNPFSDLVLQDRQFRLDIGDINQDGLPDLILGMDGDLLKAYENTGTVENPKYTLNVGWSAGIDITTFENSSPKLIDIDHDGDMDIILGKYDQLWYFENIGTPKEPAFVGHDENDSNNPLKNISLGFPIPSFNDVDGDGDQDLVSGNADGQFDYFENTNPAPVTILAEALNYLQQSTPIILDPTISISDSDNDLISSAMISIANFKPGQEALSFTPQGGVTGSFNAITGLLTLTGRASISTYISALRTVTYQFTGPTPISSGRATSSGRTNAITLNRSISFSILDQDFTTPVLKTLAVQISFGNQPPVIVDNSGVTQIGNTIDLDFTSLITDPDDNLDASSLKVIQPPQSGASYIINGLKITLDYTGTDFAGPDQFTIEVCDLALACTQKVITVQVEGEVVVKNGISPNGDGLNDFFELRNIVALEPINTVSIYTRWGDKVFEIENYDNDQRRFVGLNNNGNELTSGVYFYKVKFGSGKEDITGYLTIKR